MSGFSELDSPVDRTIGTSIVDAATAALARITKRSDGLDDPRITETGTFHYAVVTFKDMFYYKIVLMDIDRSVIRAITLSEIVSAQPRHIRQIIAGRREAGPTTKNVFQIVIHVLRDASLHDPMWLNYIELPRHRNTLFRQLAVREMLLEYAERQKTMPPSPDTPKLAANFVTDHVPVLTTSLNILMNISEFMPRAQVRIKPVGADDSQYLMIVQDMDSISYDVLEFMFERIGAVLQDVSLEQTGDDDLPLVLVLHFDMKIRLETRSCSVIRCREETKTIV